MGDSGGVTRTFDSVDVDIRAAVDALAAAIPSLRGVALWGLCDGASAALIYCSGDPRVVGMTLANPWVRTPAGEARSYLRYYYVRRLLQRSFWRKVLTGGFAIGKAAQQFTEAVRTAGAGGASPDFVARMLAGLRAFDRPVQVLLSERDLTAREFADHCRNDRRWRRAMGRADVTVQELPDADHTFSTNEALKKVTESSLAWLDRLSIARSA
jgi:exosortase A-associated hydrolase 1